MTFAERSIRDGRDDEHIIYEEYHISQYTDGSVLDCIRMKAYSAEQVLASDFNPTPVFNYSQAVINDLRKNAKKAVARG